MTELLEFEKPVWEITLRAAAVYIALILLLRAIPKRNAGTISPNDMLTLILIGSIAGDTIMGRSTSLADLLLMIGIIIALAYAFDLLEYRFPRLRVWLWDRETPLIEHGRLLRRNMRREMVTEEELMAVLRKEGIESFPMSAPHAWKRTARSAF